jgi:hypothetical protein
MSGAFMHDKRPDRDFGSGASDRPTEEASEKRRRALEVLLEARERLVTQLCDEVLASRDVLLDDAPDSIFSFEFQEIEDRYSARLQALNSILDNLEYRRPRMAHRVESFHTTTENLSRDINEIMDRFDQWDLVDIDVTAIEPERLLVVVGFTADEYVD